MGDARSIPLGRVFGIPVRMSWAVVAVSLTGAWFIATRFLPRVNETLALSWRVALALGAVLCFLASILAHEFGHALAARRHNIQTSSIRLWIFGGVAALSSSAKSPSAEFQIAIAGPAVNAALALLFAAATWLGRTLGWPDSVQLIASALALLNLLLAVTNMIPAAPLDGGRVLSSILWARTGRPEWARLVAARIGLVTGGLVIAYGLLELLAWARISGFYTAAIGAFVLVAARGDVITASIRSRLARTAVADVLWSHPPAIQDSLSLSDVERHLGTSPVSVPVQRWAHETIGYFTTGDVQSVPVHERSWTSVKDLTTPIQMVASAWTSESLLSALERHGTEPRQMLGVDPESGLVVGTTTPAQFAHLLERPVLWGGVE